MENKWSNLKTNNVILELNPDTSVIVLSANSLSTPIKERAWLGSV